MSRKQEIQADEDKISKVYEVEIAEVYSANIKYFYWGFYSLIIFELIIGILHNQYTFSLDQEDSRTRIILQVVGCLVYALILHFYFQLYKKKKIQLTNTFEVVVTLAFLAFIVLQTIGRYNQMPLKDEQANIIEGISIGTDYLFYSFIHWNLTKKIISRALILGGLTITYIALAIKAEAWIILIRYLHQIIFLFVVVLISARVIKQLFYNFWSTREAEKMKHKILDFLPESVLVLGKDGNVEYTNNHFKSYFEWDDKDITKQFANKFSNLAFREEHNLKDRNKVLTSELEPNHQQETEDIRSNLEEVSNLNDLIAVYKSNKESWLTNPSLVAIYDSKFMIDQDTSASIEIKASVYGNSENPQLIMIFKDTTERDKINFLESANLVYRNNVLASFSHELRTPLHSNMAFLQQSLDTVGIPENYKKIYLQPALDSSKLLLSLINDILDYSQILNGKFKLDLKSCDIRKTLDKCISIFNCKIAEKKINFTLDVESSVPKFFFTDHNRLLQVIVNLVSNAVKFTSSGEIKISFKKGKNEGTYYQNSPRVKRDQYQVSVYDSGIGMDADAQVKLTKNLQENLRDQMVSSNSAGYGMGLQIANSIARELSSGSQRGLHFQRNRNGQFLGGMEFFFYVDNKQQTLLKRFTKGSEEFGDSMIESPHIQITELPSKFIVDTKSRLSLSCLDKRILIVDDEIFNILVIENYCKANQISTERALNGMEALEKIKDLLKKKKCLSMIFMDINMPVMDGYDATKNIKKYLFENNLPNIDILGITAYVAQEKKDKAIECGMSDVYNKPLSKDDFYEIMRNYSLL